MRAIPNASSYYRHDAPDMPVHIFNFEPNKRRDPDGLSFFRLDFVSPRKVAKSNMHPDGVFVAMFLVKDLLGLGLSVKPSLWPEGLPGHVIVPELNHSDYKPKKKQFFPIQLALAKLASRQIVYGPSPRRSTSAGASP